MKAAGWVTVFFGIVVLIMGVTGYWRDASWVSLVMGVLAGGILSYLGALLHRGRLAAGFVICALAMLLGLFFGYQFIASESFVPGGIMLLTTFVVLFIVLIALFSSLARQQE